jgi:heat shock protein HslJ
MKKFYLLGVVGVTLGLAACTAAIQSSSDVSAPGTTAKTEGATVEMPTAFAKGVLTVVPSVIITDTLKNASYSGIYDEPVTLTNGLYEGDSFIQGDQSRPIVQYVEGAEMYTDLDGDGATDAVVFLLDRGGGTATFTYVAAQLNKNGQPVDAGAVMIEDRIGIKSAVVEDGQVRLEIITQGPGDAACCASYKAHKTYAVIDGKLVEIAEDNQNMEQVSAADLNGTSWTLVELNYGLPAAPDIQATISFQDNQISGSGGCNLFNGSFTSGGESPLWMTVRDMAATKKSCSEPVSKQESAYFTALQNVSHWGYEFGELSLSYVDDQGNLARLRFAPQNSSLP